MDYTENYHLPQWAESDRIMMDDFNQMCADMETGLTANRAAAQAALSEAEEKGFVIGSYVGTGTSMENGGQVIDLGFRPRFLIISHGWTDPNHAPSTMMIIGQAGAADVSGFLTLEDSGFRVGLLSTSFFKLNTANMVYDYIAFK